MGCAPLGQLPLKAAAAALAALVALATGAAAQCGNVNCFNGTWGKTMKFAMSPAAAVLLPSASGLQVLLWSAAQPYQFRTGEAQTSYLVMDASALIPGAVKISSVQHDMFCPGISQGASGSVYVSGGSPGGVNNDASVVSQFSPSGAWTSMPKMNIPRSYHSSATLSNGNIFVIGGSFDGGVGGKDGEVWRPGASAWTHLTNVLPDVIYTGDAAGVYRADNHAWLFGWNAGYVFHAGPSVQMNWFGTTMPGGSSVPAGNRGDTDQMNGNAVMFDAGKILAVGGAVNYDSDPSDVTYGVGLAYVITLRLPNQPVRVTPTGSLSYPRVFSTGVALPNGNVLIIGGQTIPKQFSDDNATNVPEMWDPLTGTFQQLQPMLTPRTYHHASLLLPDATVLVAGGGLCYYNPCGPTEHDDGQIYRPPYLYSSSGRLARRPVIKNAPPTAAAGATISVTTDMAVSMFSIVRFGSSTHAVDTDQRRIQLTFILVSANPPVYTYSVKIPTNRGAVLPGFWMLFGVLPSGTPSVSKTIQIR